MSALLFWKNRAYLDALEDYKAGKSPEGLIGKVERQAQNLKRLLVPREKLLTSKEELIAALLQGEIPEKEIHDFFSLWDPPE